MKRKKFRKEYIIKHIILKHEYFSFDGIQVNEEIIIYFGAFVGISLIV